MNGDIYVRDGSRFKKVPNMVGMYYNGIIFTKEQMPDTIGVVVDQKYDHIVICAINPSDICMKWDDAKKWCEEQFDGKGRMPEIKELILARRYLTHIESVSIWSLTEYSANYAWFLAWRIGNVLRSSKSISNYVYAISFLDIPIKDIM